MNTFAWPGLAVPGSTWPGYLAPDGDRVVFTPPPRSLADVLAGSHERLTSALILTGPAAGETLPITGAPVTLVHDGPVRLRGSLTVAAVEPWTAQGVRAALDPRAGVEVALAAGVRDDEGGEHWWPIGIVRPSRHARRETADAISVEVEVSDRGAVVAHAGAPRTMIVGAGTGILAGVRAALAVSVPWLPVDLPLHDDWTAETDLVLAERAGDDLWAGCRAAVRGIGRMLTIDETGTVVAPRRVAAAESSPIEVPMVGVEVEVDWEQSVHRVVARWTEARPEDADSEWQPQTGSVAVEDAAAIAELPANSPAVTRPFGGDESVLTSEPLARAAASAELADLQDLVVSGSCSTVLHPDVTPGAVIDVDGRRYRITQTSFDLAGGPVSVSLGNAARTLGVRLAESLGYRAAGTERDEIVTSIAPLMTRPIGGDVPLLVAATDAVAGVSVGDVVRVVHDGAGRRVATGMIARKTIVEKFSGETLGTIGGSTLTVDGDVSLRVRATNGATSTDYVDFANGDATVPLPQLRARIGTTTSYQTFSGGDVTLPAPDLSPYAKRVDQWRLTGYGWNPTLSGAPTTWNQSWGTSVITALADLRTLINQARSVTWQSAG